MRVLDAIESVRRFGESGSCSLSMKIIKSLLTYALDQLVADGMIYQHQVDATRQICDALNEEHRGIGSRHPAKHCTCCFANVNCNLTLLCPLLPLAFYWLHLLWLFQNDCWMILVVTVSSTISGKKFIFKTSNYQANSRGSCRHNSQPQWHYLGTCSCWCPLKMKREGQLWEIQFPSR